MQQNYKTPKGLIGRFVRFERWMMYGNNMYYLVGAICFMYIAIEALAMGTNTLYDENGAIREGYENMVLIVNLLKTFYLATVEFLFVTMFSVVVSRAKSDGWQFRDILPIGSALIVMGLITALVLSVYMVSREYISIGGPDATFFADTLDKKVEGRDYNTFVVICLSFVVAIVRTFFERGSAHEEIVEQMRQEYKEEVKEKKPESKDKKDAEAKVKGMHRKSKVEDFDDDKLEEDVQSLIDENWWDEASAKTMEKIFQRATSLDSPKPSLKIRKMDDKTQSDFESAMEFISDEGESKDGSISRENEILAAKIVAESWGVLESKDTIRANKEMAMKFSK